LARKALRVIGQNDGKEDDRQYRVKHKLTHLRNHMITPHSGSSVGAKTYDLE